jgi:hypothetical protein
MASLLVNVVPVTKTSVLPVIPLTGLYSTTPVELFLTSISVAKVLSVGVVVILMVCADNTPLTLEQIIHH